MATTAELGATMRQGLLDGLGRTCDTDRAEACLLGMFVLEAQANGYDPSAYTVPEEMRDMAADWILRVLEAGYQAWDAYQSSL